MSFIDKAIDVAKFIPGPVGSAASAISAAKNLLEGDLKGAALDAVGVLPGVNQLRGMATLGGKLPMMAKGLDKVGEIAGKVPGLTGGVNAVKNAVEKRPVIATIAKGAEAVGF